MVKLQSGIEVSSQLVHCLRSDEAKLLEWDTRDLHPHPGMDETQHLVIPIAINGISLPTERIVYYLLTRFLDEAGHQQEVYAVENSAEFIKSGDTPATMNRRKSIPVGTKGEAEEMVLNILTQYVLDSITDR